MNVSGPTNTLTGSYMYSSLMHDNLSHGVIHAVKKAVGYCAQR